MLNLQIAIGDSDLSYVQKLSDYLMTCKDHHFSVKIFSNPDHLSNNLLIQSFDILLISEAFYAQLLSHPTVTVLLIENGMRLEMNELSAIDKYQKASNLVAQLLTIYTAQTRKEIIHMKNAEQTKLIGIYSPSGGCGKTTLSLLLSKALALEGGRTLYLSLEEFPSYGKVLLSTKETSLSDLLYHVHKRSPNLMMKLEGIQKQDKDSGLLFLPPPIYYEDMVGCDPEDWFYLIDNLVENGGYKTIVIDFNTALSGLNQGIFKRCDWLLALTNLSFLQNEKLKQFYSLSQEAVHDKIITVANLTKPIIEEERPIFLEQGIRYKIPFSEALYFQKGPQAEIRMEPCIVSAVSNLMKEVMYCG